MGMLMHHTWLAQQKKADKAEKPVEKAKEEPVKEAEEPVKRTAGRRKANK